jgi:hypothetical protein
MTESRDRKDIETTVRNRTKRRYAGSIGMLRVAAPRYPAPLVDLGSRTGDVQTQDLHHGHGCESVFLWSAKSQAVRLERKHKWAITTVLP